MFSDTTPRVFGITHGEYTQMEGTKAPAPMQAIDVLRTMSGGMMIEQFRDKLAVCAKKVQYTKKDGTVTIKIKIKSSGQDQLTMIPTVTSVEPELDPDSSVFYVLDDGNLSRQDPGSGLFRP